MDNIQNLLKTNDVNFDQMFEQILAEIRTIFINNCRLIVEKSDELSGLLNVEREKTKKESIQARKYLNN